MLKFGSADIPCDDIMMVIGKEVVKKRLLNCIPTITNVIVENPQTWSACNEHRSCKIVYKVIDFTDHQRPTTENAYICSKWRKENYDMFNYDTSDTSDTSDDEINEIDKINEIDEILKNERINNISEETSYAEGPYSYQTYRGIIENTHVNKLLNNNIIKHKGDTLLNEENIWKIINQKEYIKINELEKTKMFNNIPDYFKFSKEDICIKLLNMYYNKIIFDDELFDILLFKNCILYSDTCDKFILARYDNREVEIHGHGNPIADFKMNVDIDYNNGEYNFKIDYIYYDRFNKDKYCMTTKYNNIFCIYSCDGKLYDYCKKYDTSY